MNRDEELLPSSREVVEDFTRVVFGLECSRCKQAYISCTRLMNSLEPAINQCINESNSANHPTEVGTCEILLCKKSIRTFDVSGKRIRRMSELRLFGVAASKRVTRKIPSSPALEASARLLNNARDRNDSPGTEGRINRVASDPSTTRPF